MTTADDDDEPPSAVVEPSKPRLLKVLGPGLITGASDDDPSGIATYSQAGAQFGFALAWVLLATYPLMSAVQIVSARVGRTTGRGIAGNLIRHYPAWVGQSIVAIILAANTINIGADLGAMGSATTLLIGGPQLLYAFAFGVACVLLQVLLQYRRYVTILKWLALALLAYVAALFTVKVDWGAVAYGLFVPQLPSGEGAITTVVAVLGTTISPYLFIWQSSQEAEDTRAHPRRHPLKVRPSQADHAIARINLDTLIGMGISNLIALAMLITTGGTLNKAGITDVQTTTQAAKALEPLAGPYATILFAVGVIGTGLLAVPVLAGSAAYAVGEARRWPVGLGRQPLEARAFYATIGIATLLGMALNLTDINPIQALYWSAVLNGLAAAPVMAIMMVMASSPRVMGALPIGTVPRILGWLATLVMAAAGIAMFLA